MNIKIHSAELNRIMKTIGQCIDARDTANRANICITHKDNQLIFRSSNGVFSAIMTTPVLGGDGESFCVDGGMFAKVCAMCNGEIDIITDEKTCTIKGFGRTKLSIVKASIPEIEPVNGSEVTVDGGDFSNSFNHVAYAISSDQSRIQLTGVLVESDGTTMKMVTLDGFQMSIEDTVCEGDKIKVIIPGSFMKLVSSSVVNGDSLKLTVNGTTVTAETDGMILRAGLLAGDFIDYNKILPTTFKTKSKVSVDAVRNALKAGNVVGNKQNLVRLDVGADAITVKNNSEQAEFEADIPCETQGDDLKIAFNEKYLMGTMNSVSDEQAELNFNSSVSPVVMKTMDGKGIRLLLPVRVN